MSPAMRRVTLTQFLIQRQHAGKINADLRLLIETIARACKAISTRVNKGALADGLGSAGTENVQGEVQKKLDVLSNEILLEANEWGGNLAALASGAISAALGMTPVFALVAVLLFSGAWFAKKRT